MENSFRKNTIDFSTIKFAFCEQPTTDSTPIEPLLKRRISVDTYVIDGELSQDEEKQQPQGNEPRSLGARKRAFEVYCRKLAENFQGEFVRKLERKEIYLFTCQLGHRFMLTKKQILTGGWCNGCAKTLAQIRRFVRDHNGEVLEGLAGRVIRLRCEKGHEWETNTRKACLKWCKECSKGHKKLLKELIEQENKRVEEEKRVQQVG